MHKFSIVTYIDQELTKEVRLIQHELHGLTGSNSCLKLWEPHITVGSAVNVEDNKLSALYNDIAAAILDIKPFQIRIKNFNFMDDWSAGEREGYTPYVIYLDVVVSPELQ